MSRFSKFIKGNNRLLRNRLFCGVDVDFSRHHGFNKITTRFLRRLSELSYLKQSLNVHCRSGSARLM